MSSGTAGRRGLVQALLALALALTLAQGASAEPAPDPRVEAGRRLYELGLTPDGRPLRWRMPGSASPQTGDLQCAGCHGRSGYGKTEGGVEFPALAAPVLFAAGALHREGLAANPALQRARARSAYDDAGLARALRSGLDPDGRSLRAPMPQFDLDADALAALTAYLHTLGRIEAPGWTPRGLVLAVVLTPGATPARQQAVWEVLQAWAAQRADPRQRWLLRRWALHGPAADWPAQLAAFDAAEPAYALLSGAGAGDWAPVDDFCQAHRVPCVLPSLERAPPSPQGAYGLYFHGGLDSDARTVAEAAAGARLVQWWGDAAGAQAAAAARALLPVPGGDSRDAVLHHSADDAAAMAQLEPGSTLVLWLRGPALQALLERTQPLAAAGRGPERLWLSATLADPAEVALPPAWRARASWFGVHDPQGERRSWLGLRPWLHQAGLASDELRTRGDALAAATLLGAALRSLQQQAQDGVRGPVSRERLIEALEQGGAAEHAAASPFYTTLQLGPGRHQAVARSRLWPAQARVVAPVEP